MSNNLSVSVSADVTELITKFAIAKAETSALTAEMNKLARATVAGTIDSAGTAKMQQLAGDMLHARTTAAGLSAQLARHVWWSRGYSSSRCRASRASHGACHARTSAMRPDRPTLIDAPDLDRFSRPNGRRIRRRRPRSE
jgi:hypothetical protein